MNGFTSTEPAWQSFFFCSSAGVKWDFLLPCDYLIMSNGLYECETVWSSSLIGWDVDSKWENMY